MSQHRKQRVDSCVVCGKESRLRHTFPPELLAQDSAQPPKNLLCDADYKMFRKHIHHKGENESDWHKKCGPHKIAKRCAKHIRRVMHDVRCKGVVFTRAAHGKCPRIAPRPAQKCQRPSAPKRARHGLSGAGSAGSAKPNRVTQGRAAQHQAVPPPPPPHGPCMQAPALAQVPAPSSQPSQLPPPCPLLRRHVTANGSTRPMLKLMLPPSRPRQLCRATSVPCRLQTRPASTVAVNTGAEGTRACVPLPTNVMLASPATPTPNAASVSQLTEAAASCSSPWFKGIEPQWPATSCGGEEVEDDISLSGLASPLDAPQMPPHPPGRTTRFDSHDSLEALLSGSLDSFPLTPGLADIIAPLSPSSPSSASNTHHAVDVAGSAAPAYKPSPVAHDSDTSLDLMLVEQEVELSTEDVNMIMGEPMGEPGDFDMHDDTSPHLGDFLM